MSIEKYPQGKVDSLLSVYTPDKEGQVREWFGDVRHELLKWMERHPYKRVHSVRARMKERSHLRDKIERWPKTHNDELTEDNFFEKIEDLTGARILACSPLRCFSYGWAIWPCSPLVLSTGSPWHKRLDNNPTSSIR